MTETVLVSLLAAVCFGVASVLQHDGALRVRRHSPLHPGFFAELSRRPIWLLGVVAQAAGVVLHLLAVNVGPLSVVQPLLTVGLVIALLLQRVMGRPVGPSALLSAGLVVFGLVLFLSVMPGEQPSWAPDAAAWFPGFALAGAVLLAVLSVGLSRGGTVRCVGLGAGAGVLMATSAALGKAWGGLLGAQGMAGLLGSWQLWAALACGAAGTLLSQAAYQAGPLGGSLGAMMAIDPVIGVGLGVVVYGEPFAGPDTVVARCMGLGLTLVGVWLLAAMQRADEAAARERRVLL